MSRSYCSYHLNGSGGLLTVDGSWSSWSAWSLCSVSCELGVRRRHRTCSDPLPQFAGAPCSPNADTQTESEECFERQCPSNYQHQIYTEMLSHVPCTTSEFITCIRNISPSQLLSKWYVHYIVILISVVLYDVTEVRN